MEKNQPTNKTEDNLKNESLNNQPSLKKEKQETKKIEKKKKDYAVANGHSLRISTRFSSDICRMIKGKKIEEALKMLDEVIHFKRVVQMNAREVGHKHGPGIMAGRYPINCCKEFIRLLKQLNANALANEFPVEEGVIVGKANVGSRPYRRAGQRFKDTNLNLRLERPKIKHKK